MTQELPFWSNHPRGKVFRRYTSDDVLVSDENKIKYERNTYVHNFGETFKWQIAGDISRGSGGGVITGLVEDSMEFSITTNSHLTIKSGDILWLAHTSSSKGRYFIVSNDVVQSYIYCPKMRKSFQNMTVRKVL